jgi:hypothetical protein
MEINNETIEIASQIQYRLLELAKQIAEVVPKHDGEVSMNWEYIGDGTIRLQVNSYSYTNTSCSCHPTWGLNEYSDYHTIPLEWISDDGYFDCYDEHPYIEQLCEKIMAERRAIVEEETRKAKENELKQQQMMEEQQLALYETLKKKYGG